MNLTFKGKRLVSALVRRKKVCTPKKKDTKTIIGAISLRTKKVYWKQADKGNSKTYIVFLYQLRQSSN
jgi:hypothetical protein